MGVVPLELPQGVTWKTLGLDGSETVDVSGLSGDMRPRASIKCSIHRSNGEVLTLDLRSRLDTNREIGWYRSGGILNYVFDTIREQAA
jgi:aconitate hydratase